MPWDTSKRPDGPYVEGSVNGRLRELESQVSRLTDAIDTLMSVIHVDDAGKRVSITGIHSLTLQSSPGAIELQGPHVRVRGVSLGGKDLVR